MIRLDNPVRGVSRYTAVLQQSGSSADNLVQRPKETFGIVSLIGRATPVNPTGEADVGIGEAYIEAFMTNVLTKLKAMVRQRRTYALKDLYNAFIKGNLAAAALKYVAVMRKALTMCGGTYAETMIGEEVFQRLDSIESYARTLSCSAIAWPHFQNILDVSGYAHFEKADAHIFAIVESVVYDSVSPDGSSATENWERSVFPTTINGAIVTEMSNAFTSLRSAMQRINTNSGVNASQVAEDAMRLMPELRVRNFKAESSDKEKLRTMLANSNWLGDYESSDPDRVDAHGRFAVSQIGPKFAPYAIANLNDNGKDVIIDLVSTHKDGLDPVELAGVPMGIPAQAGSSSPVPQGFFNAEILVQQAALYGVTDTDIQDSGSYLLLFNDNVENAAQVFEFFRGIGVMPGYGMLVGSGTTAGYLASSEVGDYYYHHPVVGTDIASLIWPEYITEIYAWTCKYKDTTKNEPSK